MIACSSVCCTIDSSNATNIYYYCLQLRLEQEEYNKVKESLSTVHVLIKVLMTQLRIFKINGQLAIQQLSRCNVGFPSIDHGHTHNYACAFIHDLLSNYLNCHFKRYTLYCYSYDMKDCIHLFAMFYGIIGDTRLTNNYPPNYLFSYSLIIN